MSDVSLDGQAPADDREAFVLADFMPYRIVALGHAISRRLARASLELTLDRRVASAIPSDQVGPVAQLVRAERS